MNRLDKCIKINFRMVSNEIGIMCVAGGAMCLCFLSLIMLIIIPVLAIVQLVFTVKMYEKLFYTGLYGETALLYQSLPVTWEEMTVSKIFTAGTGNLMAQLVTFICMAAGAGLSSFGEEFADIFFKAWSMTLETSGFQTLVPLNLLAAAASIYRMSAFILMAIVLYNSRPAGKRGDWSRVAAFVIGGAVHVAISSIDDLLHFLGAPMTSLWVPVLCMAIDIVLTVVFYRVTVRKLYTCYALN